MWGGSLSSEIRDSARLLGTERWLFAGSVAAYVALTLWVLITGTVALTVAPSLGETTLLTVAGKPLDALTAFAALVWVVLPGVVTVPLLDRHFRNRRGNLESPYRFDHPSLLLAPPGLVMLAVLGLTLVRGQSLPLLAVGTIASAHLFVRTMAYGHRVYSLSVPRLFSLFAFLVGGALAVGWVAHAPSLATVSGALGTRLSATGVTSVAETAVVLSGTDASGLLTAAVSFPALLSAGYLAAQSLVAATVYLRAPIENPQPRAGQRYPPNASVNTAAPSPKTAQVATDGATETGAAATADADEATDAEPETDAPDERPGTRVFTPDQPVPELDETEVADETGEKTNDEWFEDTAVYTEAAASDGTPDECPSCRTDIPLETSVSFCPNCGERLD